MRKIHKSFLFLALLLLSFSSHAQYFDWVKTYSGQDRGSGGYNNIPTGTVNDSEGNIYYLGDFGLGAGIDTTHFLPFAPSGPGRNTSGTVIAKFSPSGELLWHKIIYSNNGQHTSAYQIQMLGDTARAFSTPTKIRPFFRKGQNRPTKVPNFPTKVPNFPTPPTSAR